MTVLGKRFVVSDKVVLNIKLVSHSLHQRNHLAKFAARRMAFGQMRCQLKGCRNDVCTKLPEFCGVRNVFFSGKTFFHELLLLSVSGWFASEARVMRSRTSMAVICSSVMNIMDMGSLEI